jgi:hypothetical protein
VVWRRNGSIVPSQTDQLLEFSAISEADEGVWTCTMTNECGVTEPPAITITVNAGAFATSTISGDTLLCGHGDSALLAGNTGGTWSTGATTAGISVTQPGSYYVYNQQACGLSMSNTILVQQLDSALAPDLHVYGAALPEVVICPQDSIQLSVHDPWHLAAATPVWNDGSTALARFLGEGSYSISVTNACGSDTSNTIMVNIIPPPVPPIPTFADVFGNPADGFICVGDSVVLRSPVDVAWYFNGAFLPNNGTSVVAYEEGLYQTVMQLCGQFHASAPVQLQVDSFPPAAPAVILPDQAVLQGCIGDTEYLTSQYPNVFWTTEAFGVLSYDTTAQLLVDWAENEYVLTNYNGCGDSPTDAIQIEGIPPPVVSYTETIDTLCLTVGPVALSAGTPAGGTYAGEGVSGNSFDPAVAGFGTHAITYSYFDGFCSSHVLDSITVDACMAIGELEQPEDRITVTPNPNNGMFALIIERTFAFGRASLYDVSGQQVAPTVRLRQGANAMDVRDLAPGAYCVLVELDGNVWNRVIVVTRE